MQHSTMQRTEEY